MRGRTPPKNGRTIFGCDREKPDCDDVITFAVFRLTRKTTFDMLHVAPGTSGVLVGCAAALN